MRRTMIVLTASTLGAFILTQAANAGRVRVSEDFEGDGNFVVQGFVETFDQSASTAASIYGYDTTCNVSYSGSVFVPDVDKTTLAVIDTSEGRTLFVVHDAPERGAPCPYQSGDITDGRSINVYDLAFDADGMDCMVKDDSGGGGIDDEYVGCGGGANQISANHGWAAVNTDGVVLGTLEGPWQLDMSYVQDGLDVLGVVRPDGVLDITEVVVLGGDGNNITGLNPPNTVRLDNVLEVEIDIKPNSDPNCFNINDHGVVPVAILGSADFDVSLIDQSTLRFSGLVVRVRGNGNPQCSIQESNGDAFSDLVCQFVDDSTAWDPGETTAELSGELNDTTPFYGEDTICVRPPDN